jgi:thioredoxin reductase
MDVIIIGDGPAGLSAALFLAKKGKDVVVFGQDETPMHYARLLNYLGIPEITGTAFLEVARAQVANFGADLRSAAVTAVEPSDSGFVVTTEDGGRHACAYVILAEGKAAKLAERLGLRTSSDGVDVDRDGRTSVDGLFFVGRGTKVRRSQAIISAGEGASAALAILSDEAGKDVLDYDTVD